MGSAVDSAPLGLCVGETERFPFNEWPKFGELFWAAGPALNLGQIALQISAAGGPSLHVGLGPAFRPSDPPSPSSTTNQETLTRAKLSQQSDTLLRNQQRGSGTWL